MARASAVFASCTASRAWRQRGGVGAALERRARQQFASFTVELRVDPALLAQQLVDFGPSIPAGGGARGDDQRGRRASRWILQNGRDELRRAPRMPGVDRLLRGGDIGVLCDGAREIALGTARSTLARCSKSSLSTSPPADASCPAEHAVKASDKPESKALSSLRGNHTDRS